MNMRKLAKEIAKKEGKKKSVSIAQIAEILGILSDLLAGKDGMEILEVLYSNGKRRAKK